MEWGFEVCGDTLPNISTYFAKYLYILCQVSPHVLPSIFRPQKTTNQTTKQQKTQTTKQLFSLFPLSLQKIKQLGECVEVFFYLYAYALGVEA